MILVSVWGKFKDGKLEILIRFVDKTARNFWKVQENYFKKVLALSSNKYKFLETKSLKNSISPWSNPWHNQLEILNLDTSHTHVFFEEDEENLIDDSLKFPWRDLSTDRESTSLYNAIWFQEWASHKGNTDEKEKRILLMHRKIVKYLSSLFFFATF